MSQIYNNVFLKLFHTKLMHNCYRNFESTENSKNKQKFKSCFQHPGVNTSILGDIFKFSS